MKEKYCIECGEKLKLKENEGEGKVPFCKKCGKYRFERYSTAVSMIVRDEKSGDILLIKQYGRDSYILVAGYVNPGEGLEEAVGREIREETGMNASRIIYNKSEFFPPSDTLMCNFTAFVDKNELNTNDEIDSCRWFSLEEARENIRKNSLARKFLISYLNSLNP